VEALRDPNEVGPSEIEIKAALASIDDIKPTNEMKAILAEQMAATHSTDVGRRRSRVYLLVMVGGNGIRRRRTPPNSEVRSLMLNPDSSASDRCPAFAAAEGKGEALPDEHPLSALGGGMRAAGHGGARMCPVL